MERLRDAKILDFCQATRGSATKTELGGVFAYVGQVSHFTWWNADIIYQTTCIRGRVVTTAGDPVANALISAVGLDYNGISYAHTEADGSFAVNVRRSSQVELHVLVSEGNNASRIIDAQDHLAHTSNPEGCSSIGDIAVSTIPFIEITAPQNGSSFSYADTITFVAIAIDVQDGDLSDSVFWTSSEDGFLDTSASISATLSEASHIITASVTDSGGDTGSASIKVIIANYAPSVNITAPQGYSTFGVADTITFTATADDHEDGDLSGSIS